MRAVTARSNRPHIFPAEPVKTGTVKTARKFSG